MPYFLERAEQVLDKQRHWVKQGQTVHGPRRHRRRPRQARHPGDVPRPRLRLLHRGPPRHRQPRRDRRGQRHVRDRLPALRLDVARLHRHRAARDQGPARGRPVQAPARQRRAALPLHAGRAAGAPVGWRSRHGVVGIGPGRNRRWTRGEAVEPAESTRASTDERHAARGQERHHHRRRLRRRPGVGAAVRRGGRAASCAPTSTSTAPRRRCG